MASSDLQDLFLRYRSHGDLRALAEVFDRVAPDLLRIARLLVSQRADAEDAVQETFVAAMQGASAFDAARRLEPWLVGILTNQARALRRARRAGGDRDLAQQTSASPQPLAAAQEAEFRHLVDRALRGVPPIYRDVLLPVLRDGEERRAIARRLGRAPGTVRMQVHRGLALLRRALPPGLVAGTVALTARPALARIRGRVLRSAGGHMAVAPSTVAGALVLKKSTASCIALFLVVGLGSLWWWSGTGEAVPGVRHHPAALRSADPLEIAPLDAAAAPHEAASSPRESVPSPEAGDTASAPDAGIEVLVVGADDSAPLPGAAVDLIDPAALPPAQKLALERGGCNLERVARAFGQRAYADAAGIARVSDWQGKALLLGRKDAFSGIRLVRFGSEEPVVLELARGPAVRAHVTDEVGAPLAGVPVVLGARSEGRTKPLFLRATDAEGQAVFGRVGAALQLGGEGELVVAPAVVVAEALEQVVALSREEVECHFRLPPTGRVELLLEDDAGRRVDEPHVVEVRALRAGASGVAAVVAMSGGRAELDHVGLGLQLGVTLQSLTYAEQESQHPGPVVPGDTAMVRLRPLVVPVVTLRVEERGVPVVSESLRVVLRDRGANDAQHHVLRTDVRGTIRLRLPRATYQGGSRTLLLRRERGTEAVVDISRPLALGDNDLGVVELAQAPVLVSGVVSGPAGHALPGARIRVFSERVIDGEVRWDDLPEMEAMTDDSGRFEIRGWIPDGTRVAVDAVLAGRTAPLQVVIPGRALELCVTDAR